MGSKVTKVVGMTPLQALVTETMRRRGWTPADVEAKGVSHATLHRYMQPTSLRQLPRQSVLQSLADGLELDVETVRGAAYETLEGRSAEPWRASFELAQVDGLEIAVLVDRIDRTPITEADLFRGLDHARRALAASEKEPADAAAKTQPPLGGAPTAEQKTPEQEKAEAEAAALLDLRAGRVSKKSESPKRRR